MTQAQQSEAQRLAAICETKGMFPVADELNRMHARILELEQGKCLHQIAEPAAPVVKPIKDAIDALVMAAFTEGGCSEHRMSEARIQTELRKKELRTLLSTPQPCSRSHPHEEMTPMCELRTEIARLTNALARAEAQLAAAPQAVQPAVPTDADIDAAMQAFDWDGWIDQDKAKRAFTREALARRAAPAQQFQVRVGQWLMECFGHDIAHDGMERNHRFLEEALELVQSLGCTASEAHQLVDYVYGRPVGEPIQELGGVMVTLAALCFAHELDMAAGADKELARICDPATMAKIKAKQAAKPRHSPLPQPAAQGLDAQDASRWREAIKKVGAENQLGAARYVIRGLEAPRNVMRGCVSGHFTKSIDAAIAAQAKQGGA